MLRATGRVGRVESKPWAMDGKSGTTHTVRLIVGTCDVLDVKVPEDQTLPEVRTEVDWGVVALSNERGRMTVKRVLDWSEVIDVDSNGELRSVV
jgi:hypothetical protein